MTGWRNGLLNDPLSPELLWLHLQHRSAPQASQTLGQSPLLTWTTLAVSKAFEASKNKTTSPAQVFVVYLRVLRQHHVHGRDLRAALETENIF